MLMRDDVAVASRQQHGGRPGGARRQRAVVERVHRAGGTAGRARFSRASSDSPRCSTTSARLPTAKARPSPLLWLGAGYLLLWLFLTGGILDRYARARPTRSYEFFTACGVYFVRFLRLAPFIALAYYVLFAVVHPMLLDDWFAALTRDVTVERTAFLVRLGAVCGLRRAARARQHRLRLREGARRRRRSPQHDRRDRRGRTIRPPQRRGGRGAVCC